MPADSLSLTANLPAFKKKTPRPLDANCLIDPPHPAIIDAQLPFLRQLAVASIQSGMFVSEQTMRPRLARSSLTLIAAAVVLPLFSARIAAGSCGDYVALAGNRGHDSRPSSPGMPSCRGANCQRQIPPPALPARALLSFQNSDCAFLPQTNSSSNPPMARMALEQRLSLCEGHLLRLLRPPRV
jgi:hypothetical protein